jgi:hypothetical protein
MPDVRDENKYGYYKCGQCGAIVEYLLSEGIPDICPDASSASGDCAYEHKTRDKYDVPSEIKLDLTQY